jgi:tRNA/tmRNA/rRNA uracil-C5-methylase (TrmA/RlmC/RlmD family)
LFGLPLARKFVKVTSVEIGGSANGDLQFNLERAGLKAKGVFNRAEDWLAAAQETPDLIICDPATLARDLKDLLAGGYEIADLTLIDLFSRHFIWRRLRSCG